MREPYAHILADPATRSSLVRKELLSRVTYDSSYGERPKPFRFTLTTLPARKFGSTVQPAQTPDGIGSIKHSMSA